jgi:N-acetylglucosaminyldiphosphoundecaprenol N-acetyl-beta-D-mannosaminyltransferase
MLILPNLNRQFPLSASQGASFKAKGERVLRLTKLMLQRLEWLHRLASEPGRLWKRYLVTNSLFILGAIKQLLLR